MAQKDLPAVTTLTGEKFSALKNLVRKQFERIELLEATDDEEEPFSVKAVVVDTENPANEQRIGIALTDYVLALIYGATAGRGINGDGAAQYASNHRGDVPELEKYTLSVYPEKRGFPLQATVTEFMDLVDARNNIVQQSLALHDIPRRVRNQDQAEKPPDVVL